jgi:gamma-glutamyltranspeptidase / glutathione hydrolase
MMRRPPTLAGNGMVVASHPLAAEAGLSILRAGGHAVDAAVAAAAVLALVEPSTCGLGGDAFLLIADQADGAASALNGSGAAPAGLTVGRLAGLDRMPLRGPLSPTVPGAVAAWGEAWYGWGRLEWEDLLAPALHLADEGFPISWRMARVLAREAATLRDDAELSRLYLHADGSPCRAGEICRNEPLARTFKALARDGAEGFYNGDLAEKLARGVKAAGGVLEAHDLAAHESALVQPSEYALRSGPAGASGIQVESRAGTASGNASEWILYEQPLPSQGILLPIMLGLLEAGDEHAKADPPWIELHRQIEAAKIAFALRDLLLADPASLPVSEADLTGVLLSPEVICRLAGQLEGEPLPPALARDVVYKLLQESGPAARDLLAVYTKADLAGQAQKPGRSGSDTTYLCAADGEGNAVGLIQSIFHPFGCGFVEPSTGVLLNNRACGFSLDSTDPNRLEPGKRPRHTLNSYMLYSDGRPYLTGGTPGADHQVQTNLQVLRHILAGRPRWTGPAPMVKAKWSQARVASIRVESSRVGSTGQPPMLEPECLTAALDAPRWGLGPDGMVRLEARFPAETTRRLRKLGHPVQRIGPWEGSGFVQAIRCLENGVYLGATDPRGEGLALGF